MAGLPDFPEVRISAERLDIREFSPADASLVREVLQCGEWLPLSTALVETTEYPADVDWWLADAVHEPRRDRTGLNLMMLAREADRIVGWIYPTAGGLQRTSCESTRTISRPCGSRRRRPSPWKAPCAAHPWRKTAYTMSPFSPCSTTRFSGEFLKLAAALRSRITSFMKAWPVSSSPKASA